MYTKFVCDEPSESLASSVTIPSEKSRARLRTLITAGCIAMVTATMTIFPHSAGAVTFIEKTVSTSKSFPHIPPYPEPDPRPGGVLYSTTTDCMECASTELGLFDGSFGALRSVKIQFEGHLWGSHPDAVFDYSSYLDFGIWTAGEYFGIFKNIAPDASRAEDDVEFSGVVDVPETAIELFVANGSTNFAKAGFWGGPYVYFYSETDRETRALGATYDVTVRYGYDPLVAAVPLPPTALLFVGSLGALFAASRRRSGSAA